MNSNSISKVFEVTGIKCISEDIIENTRC